MKDVPSVESIRSWIEAACRAEVFARKPGNVHPEAAFDDLTVDDFLVSAEVSAPVLAQAGQIGVGPAVLQAARATHDAVGTNTNLGLLLLIAPLAAVPPSVSLQDGIHDVLAGLTLADAEAAYGAIRIAHAGGLGEVSSGDVASGPSGTLREMMRLAADRDLVALQYTNGFNQVLQFGSGELKTLALKHPWDEAVVLLALRFHAAWPDSLIARKCGTEVAKEASKRARATLESGWPDGETGAQALNAFDRWLREDGHRRNPGTTADLVGATIFAALRDGTLDRAYFQQ